MLARLGRWAFSFADIKIKLITHMQNFPQRVRDNILPLSVGSTLPEAFEEWSFTERTVDHGTPDEICGLCDQDGLRYHFEIKNALTQNHLWVGSHCILQFNLSVFEHGVLLSPGDSKKKLERLMRQMRLESCIKALQVLANSEGNEILKSALAFYTKNKYLTPKYAFVVLWRLQEHCIDHSPGFFKISLQKEKYKNDLRDMPKSRIKYLWPALTSSQRILAMEMGHKAPEEL